MLKILKVRPWRCGGGKEADEEGGGDRVPITPINPARELWLGLQAAAVCSSMYVYRDVIATRSSQADPLRARTSRVSARLLRRSALQRRYSPGTMLDAPKIDPSTCGGGGAGRQGRAAGAGSKIRQARGRCALGYGSNDNH